MHLPTLASTLVLWLLPWCLLAQAGTNGASRSEEGRPIQYFDLTIGQAKHTLGGVTAASMTINGTIPGPTLEMNEGDLAIIRVTNRMSTETSMHWHGLILPNYYDGVPYLTTPPIKPDSTLEYRIPINQAGTYWYHAHTMLQEQKGLYGAIIIHPKENPLSYDHDLAVVLSDWTNERPVNVLRNLKRGNEWYQTAKGTAVPLSAVIARGALGAQLKFWRDRMEGADIADVYYPTFLVNGKAAATYPTFKTGERVRLRFINAAASTYFWLDIGGGRPLLVASDGIDIVPVYKDRLLFAIAETYDFIVTIPDGQLEIKATAQDGSGHATLRLGSGSVWSAETIERPDKIDMMQQMGRMDMKMGAPALRTHPHKNPDKRRRLDKVFGMSMEHGMHGDGQGHQGHQMPDSMSHDMHQGHQPMNQHQGHQAEGVAPMGAMTHTPSKAVPFDYTARQQYFDYAFLKAQTPTTFDTTAPIRTIHLNLTGNMNRYVWSMNGVPLTETDVIQVDSGEVLRITFNNLTMMHHPMHLHGHFFRVINTHGERSPLKHTVNVPPMREVTIEFYGEEEGDWLMHCHVLYHMMSGMSRIFSYDTPRDPRMEDYPVSTLIKESNPFFAWGTAEIGSHFTELNLTASNNRHEFNLWAEYGYFQALELELSYDYYLNDWVRLYAGGHLETDRFYPDFADWTPVAKAGLKYFAPYRFNVDFSVDHLLRPRLRIDRELLLFPRVFLEAEVDYVVDFGWVRPLEDEAAVVDQEIEWSVGLSYLLSRNLSLFGNYHNQFGWGGGLVLRF